MDTEKAILCRTIFDAQASVEQGMGVEQTAEAVLKAGFRLVVPEHEKGIIRKRFQVLIAETMETDQGRVIYKWNFDSGHDTREQAEAMANERATYNEWIKVIDIWDT